MTQPVATPLALEHTDSKESKGEFVENASPISKSIDGDDEGHVTTKTWIVVFVSVLALNIIIDDMLIPVKKIDLVHGLWSQFLAIASSSEYRWASSCR